MLRETSRSPDGMRIPRPRVLVPAGLFLHQRLDVLCLAVQPKPARDQRLKRDFGILKRALPRIGCR